MHVCMFVSNVSLLIYIRGALMDAKLTCFVKIVNILDRFIVNTFKTLYRWCLNTSLCYKVTSVYKVIVYVLLKDVIYVQVFANKSSVLFSSVAKY